MVACTGPTHITILNAGLYTAVSAQVPLSLLLLPKVSPIMCGCAQMV